MLSTSSLLSALVTLLVTIGPVETGVVFTGVTAGVHRFERRSLAVRAVLIAGLVLVLFGLGGGIVLGSLHISLPAFRMAGGVLLFLQAATLTFASPGLSSISESEKYEACQSGDIAVFPLAFPIIAGPGSLTAVVLLMQRATTLTDRAVVLGTLILCLALTLAAMLAAERLLGWLGQTGSDVVSRISGVLLAALAVQFVFDSLAQAPFLGRL